MILSSTLARVVGKPGPVHETHFLDGGINPAKYPATIKDETLVGIELEFENYTHKLAHPNLVKPMMYLWDVKSDGSLRNHGIEFITHLGFNATDAELALNYMAEALETPEYKRLDASIRCGVHIHLNLLKERVDTIHKFIILYGIFEKFLFKLSGSRDKNLNCVPLLETRECTYLTQFLTDPTSLSDTAFRAILQRFDKYCAFNLLALRTHGTIEFRHHVGTRNMNEVIEWMRTLLSLLNFARKIDTQHLLNTLFELNTKSHYAIFFSSVFPHLGGTTDQHIKDDLRENVATLKELLLLSKQQQDVPVVEPFQEWGNEPLVRSDAIDAIQRIADEWRHEQEQERR